MKTAGIIAEFNPFHKGHKYIIEEAKRITGADRCIIVMSGDFTQRGTPAVMDKSLRTLCALKSGADAVFEMPVCYSTASAELFALAGVSLLTGLGADYICFGCETGNIEVLDKIAECLFNLPESANQVIAEDVKSGIPYPKARANAINTLLPDVGQSDEIMAGSNNILAIEYLKAVRKLSSSIIPVAIKRVGNNYNDNSSCGEIISAMGIRSLMNNDSFIFGDKVPVEILDVYRDNYGKNYPVFEDDFSNAISQALTGNNAEEISAIYDISPDLANRIIKVFSKTSNYLQICNEVKNKSITYTHVQRALIHALLSITDKDVKMFIDNGLTFYIRLLGFREPSKDVLTHFKSCSKVPIITKLSDFESTIKAQNNACALKMLALDIRSSEIYQNTVSIKFGLQKTNEYQRQIVIVK